MLIREHADFFLGMERKWKYFLIFAAGLGLAYLEIVLLRCFDVLVFAGHMVGYGIAAAAVCCFALSIPQVGFMSFTSLHGRSYSRRIYALSYPVAFGIMLLEQALPTELADILIVYTGIFVYLISLLIVYLSGLILYVVHRQPIESVLDAWLDEEQNGDNEAESEIQPRNQSNELPK